MLLMKESVLSFEEKNPHKLGLPIDLIDGKY